MQPGYELDKAVAKAIGHGWEETTDFSYHPNTYGQPSYWNFHPSTDANHTLLAAKISGLFSHGGVALLKSGDDKVWFITGPYLPDDGMRSEFSDAENTDPLAAICEAILKLKEQN